MVPESAKAAAKTEPRRLSSPKPPPLGPPPSPPGKRNPRLVPELSRQGPPRLGALTPLGLATLGVALAPFARPRAAQQFRKVLCRLDREWLDCIVLKTHLHTAEQVSVAPG